MKKNEIRKIRQAIHLNSLLIKELREKNDVIVVLNRRDSFHHVYFNDNRLDELFLLLFPVEEIEKLSNVLYNIKTANGTVDVNKLSSTRGTVTLYSDLINSLNKINQYFNQALTNSSCEVFYSWQSDLPNKTNRNFIQDAINKAISKIDMPLKLDKDTMDRAGSPDIVRVIQEKINECYIFIADISLSQYDKKLNKKSPNPNVLLELGYAQGILSEENIIMIFNEAYGGIDELPFDLRGKRIMIYNCPEKTTEEEKTKFKQELVKKLQYAIQLRCKTENLR